MVHDILISLLGLSHPIALHLQYIIDGIIGGVLYILVMKYGWGNHRTDIFRRLGMGGIAGHLVFIAGWPNSVTAMSLGYFGIDAIESLMNKFNKKKNKKC